LVPNGTPCALGNWTQEPRTGRGNAGTGLCLGPGRCSRHLPGPLRRVPAHGMRVWAVRLRVCEVLSPTEGDRSVKESDPNKSTREAQGF